MYDVTTWLTNNCNTHLSDISRIKDNQSMKFGQLSNKARGIFTFKNYVENEIRKLVLDLFIWRKSKWPAAWFQYISIALNLA